MIKLLAFFTVCFCAAYALPSGIQILPYFPSESSEFDDLELDTNLALPAEARLTSLLGTKGNLSAIIAGAPNDTASLTFVPLITLLQAALAG